MKKDYCNVEDCNVFIVEKNWLTDLVKDCPTGCMYVILFLTLPFWGLQSMIVRMTRRADGK